MLARGRDRRALALTSLMVLAVLAATSGSGTTIPTVATTTSSGPVAGAPLIVSSLEGPASVTAEPSAVPPSPLVRDAAVSQIGSPSDIPSMALGAYQRADSVLGTADAACRLPWTLIAAVGRVESDHGRHDGSALDDEGVARPAIVGVRLDGRGATARLRDSDAGVLDDDKRFDRAVGPMQFIPSTWAVVGVDADGDGARNPQDIDDAALAAGVYLCAGDEDLSTEAGRRTAVHRYNRSDAYVDLVLQIMASYERSTTLAGSFTTEAVFAFDPRSASSVAPEVQGDERTDGPSAGPGSEPSDEPTDEPTDGPTPGPAPEPTQAPTPTTTAAPTATPTPTPVPSPTPSEPAPSPTPLPSEPAPSPAPSEPAPSPTPSEPVPAPAPSEPVPSATPTSSEPTPTPSESTPVPTPTPTPTEPPSDEAVAACTELGYVDDPARTDDEFDQCVIDYDLLVEVQTLCAELGLVDDPARPDDEFDQCVTAELDGRTPDELSTPTDG